MYSEDRVTLMSDTSPFVDGRTFLITSPFRSGWFVISTVLGLIAVVLDMLIVYRYWHVLSANIIAALAVTIGVELIYQWWRALRYYSKIRSLYLKKAVHEAKEGTDLDLALRIAAGGLANILFYCNGIALVLLALLGVCLRHISGTQ